MIKDLSACKEKLFPVNGIEANNNLGEIAQN